MIVALTKEAVMTLATLDARVLDDAIQLGDDYGVEFADETVKNFNMRRFRHETISDVIVQMIGKRPH